MEMRIRQRLPSFKKSVISGNLFIFLLILLAACNSNKVSEPIAGYENTGENINESISDFTAEIPDFPSSDLLDDVDIMTADLDSEFNDLENIYIE